MSTVKQERRQCRGERRAVCVVLSLSFSPSISCGLPPSRGLALSLLARHGGNRASTLTVKAAGGPRLTLIYASASVAPGGALPRYRPAQRDGQLDESGQGQLHARLLLLLPVPLLLSMFKRPLHLRHSLPPTAESALVPLPPPKAADDPNASALTACRRATSPAALPHPPP